MSARRSGDARREGAREAAVGRVGTRPGVGGTGGAFHELRATPATCFWGFFDNAMPPVLRVKSGDIVYLETLTPLAGDAPDLLMDEGTRLVYDGIKPEDRGPGAHLMTGPIHIDGAEPGDTLQVRILRLEPRLPYGSNVAGWWGYLYDDFNKVRITIYRCDVGAGLARAIFAYDYTARPQYLVPPVDVTPPDPAARQPVLQDVVVPLRLHLGVAGVAPKEDGKISSIPPGSFGGNVDQRRFGPGASMYYPVFHPGALFYAGDAHLAEGDGELCGTGIEASVNAWVQFVVRKDFPVTNPILETDTHWYTHGFDEDLNKAMRMAAREMLGFLTTTMGLTRDDAYSLMSVAGDFGVTQVVDIRQGIHAGIAKSLFLPK